MPKVYDIDSKPKDIYICAKYNETVSPNEVLIIGYMTCNEIKKFPIEQNKGAPYYKIPINKLHAIESLKDIL